MRRGCIKSKLFYSFFLQKNSTSLLETLSNENGGVIWVSQKVGREPNQKGLQTLQKRFKTLELAHNMRNTKEIINETKKWDMRSKQEKHIQKMSILPIHPQGKELVTFSNLIEAIQAAQKVASRGVIVIYKYLTEVPDHLDLIKEFDRSVVVYSPTLKESSNHTFDAFNHLQTKGNILVTSYKICEGFEWDSIVVVIGGSTLYNEFRFLRCTKNLFSVR